MATLREREEKGEEMEERQGGKGLGLLRSFSGIVKQERVRGGRNLEGKSLSPGV